MTKPWETRTLTMANFLARKRVESTLKLADRLITDPDKERRLKEQRCLACFYYPVIAGQAFTDAPCACCGKEERYSTTDTELLCETCAGTHNLCKRCGADIHLNGDRKQWPTDTPATDT